MDKPPDEKRGHDAVATELMHDVYRTTQDADVEAVFIVIVGRNLNSMAGAKSSTWLHVHASEASMPTLLERAETLLRAVEADSAAGFPEPPSRPH